MRHEEIGKRNKGEKKREAEWRKVWQEQQKKQRMGEEDAEVEEETEAVISADDGGRSSLFRIS